MFAMSRRELRPAYLCGTYHRRGRAGCSSHHICTDKLDELLERLNEGLSHEQEDVEETELSADRLAEVLADL